VEKIIGTLQWGDAICLFEMQIDYASFQMQDKSFRVNISRF